MIEKLREELYKLMLIYGSNDIRTMRKSEELDIEINKEMHKKIGALKSA